MLFKKAGFIFVAVVAICVTGCATAVKKNEPMAFDTAMSAAEAKVKSGSQDAAISAFEDAAKFAPTRKEPWVRIAQLQFDRGQYARAIVAAEEVLQRDPADLVADGVITVAGLRVASQSLGRLQGRGVLVSDAAKTEAKALERSLLVVLPRAEDSVQPAKTKVRRKTARTTRESAPEADEAPSVRQPSKGKSDPFRNLGL